MSNAIRHTVYVAVLAIVADTCWDLAGESAFSSAHWASTVLLVLIVVATAIAMLARMLREDREAHIDAERCREHAHRWADRVLDETDALLTDLTTPPRWRDPARDNVPARDPLAQPDAGLAFLQQRSGWSEGRGHGVSSRRDA